MMLHLKLYPQDKNVKLFIENMEIIEKFMPFIRNVQVMPQWISVGVKEEISATFHSYKFRKKLILELNGHLVLFW